MARRYYNYITGTQKNMTVRVNSRHVTKEAADTFLKASPSLQLFKLIGEGRNPDNGDILSVSTPGVVQRKF